MISKRSSSDSTREDRFSTSEVDRMSADTMTVRKLQPKKTSVGVGGVNKRDQIVIPPFVASIYDPNLSDKLIDRRRNKPTTAKKFPTDFKLRTPKMSFVDFDADDSKPKLRFNVEDFRKRFNMKAVAFAELAFVKIAGKQMAVQTSKP